MRKNKMGDLFLTLLRTGCGNSFLLERNIKPRSDCV